MSAAAFAPRPRPPQPHPASFGWRPGQGPPAAFLEATRRWLGPPPTAERLAAIEASAAAQPHREDVELALALMLLALTGNPVEPAGEGLAWRDWATLTPADWSTHDRRMLAIRQTVETPDADRTDATWEALAKLPEKYQRLFDSLEVIQEARDGMAVTDPDAKPSKDLEAARRRVAGRATSKAAT